MLHRKWKTSLFCLLRMNWTQRKEDRTADRQDSSSSGSGEKIGTVGETEKDRRYRGGEREGRKSSFSAANRG